MTNYAEIHSLYDDPANQAAAETHEVPASEGEALVNGPEAE